MQLPNRENCPVPPANQPWHQSPPQFRAAEIMTCKWLRPKQHWMGVRGKRGKDKIGTFQSSSNLKSSQGWTSVLHICACRGRGSVSAEPGSPKQIPKSAQQQKPTQNRYRSEGTECPTLAWKTCPSSPGDNKFDLHGDKTVEFLQRWANIASEEEEGCGISTLQEGKAFCCFNEDVKH